MTRSLPPQPSSARHAVATIHRALDRVRVAWRVLRHGPAVAIPARPGVEVPLTELHDAVECILALVGLPYQWAATATSFDLDALANAVAVARLARETEWTRFLERCSRTEVRS